MDEVTRHLLTEAAREIRSLRQRNEVLAGQVAVVETFRAALLGPPGPMQMTRVLFPCFFGGFIADKAHLIAIFGQLLHRKAHLIQSALLGILRELDVDRVAKVRPNSPWMGVTRYSVNSATAAKKGLDEAYVVDVLAIEETAQGKVTGTCGCKGWQVRKTCSHLTDAREYHERVATVAQAATLGFDHLPPETGNGSS
jgi:hypothetical protein